MNPPSRSDSVCARCSGDLEEGFLADHGDMQMLGEGAWARGKPNRSRWRLTALAKGQQLLPILGLRCTRCGLVEFHANEET
jgi:ribosomal protein S27AE